MAYPVVKIHELPEDSWEGLDEEKDLFLKSKRVTDKIDPADIKSGAFISEAALLKDMYKKILVNPQTINHQWTFISGTYPPLQLTLFQIVGFFHQYFENKERLDQMLNFNGTVGYPVNNVFFSPEFRNKQTNKVDGTNVSQYAVANLDYTNCLIGFVYRAIRDIIEKLIRSVTDINCDYYYEPSFVGQIVHATGTLLPGSTTEDSEVRKIFGSGKVIASIGDFEIRQPDTHWVLHKNQESLYSLRCSNQNVVSGTNGLSKNGGDNSNREFTDNPKHTHSGLPGHNHGGRWSGSTSRTVAEKQMGSDIDTFNSKGDWDTAWNTEGGSAAKVSVDTGEVDEQGRPIIEWRYRTQDELESGMGKQDVVYHDVFPPQVNIDISTSSASCTSATLNIKETATATKGSINIESAYKNCFMWERVS